MINRDVALFRAGGLAAMVAIASFTVGCGEDEVAQAPAPKPVAPPPPPPPPPIPTIAQLMQQRGYDERIILAEEQAPSTLEDRIAVLDYFDAFVRGDKDALSASMSGLDQAELNAVVETDAWKSAIEKIEQVRLVCGSSSEGLPCALAMFVVDGSDQPQLWTYERGAPDYVWTSVATPPNISDKLYGDDLITLWFKIIEEETLLAAMPDEDVSLKNVDLSKDDTPEEQSETGGGGGPSMAPGGPGGLPTRRPTPARRPPPGPGGPAPASPGGG